MTLAYHRSATLTSRHVTIHYLQLCPRCGQAQEPSSRYIIIVVQSRAGMGSQNMFVSYSSRFVSLAHVCRKCDFGTCFFVTYIQFC